MHRERHRRLPGRTVLLPSTCGAAHDRRMQVVCGAATVEGGGTSTVLGGAFPRGNDEVGYAGDLAVEVVIRQETSVSAPGFRPRKYDGTVQINGQWYGIDVKGGTAKKNPSQRAFDDWLNMPGNTVTTAHGRTLVGVFDVWIDR